MKKQNQTPSEGFIRGILSKLFGRAALTQERNYWREEALRWKDTALTDGLTGASNRRGLIEQLGSALRKAKWENEESEETQNGKRKNGTSHSVALGFIDLDKFKNINDTLGHEAGDYVLKAVAQYLKSALRNEDIVSLYNRPDFCEETVTRLGGDEFVIVLQHTDEAHMRTRAKEIEEGLNKLTIEYKETKINVRGTMGVVNCDTSLSAEDNLRLADEAMIRRKHSKSSHFNRRGGQDPIINGELSSSSKLTRFSINPEPLWSENFPCN